MSKDLKIGVCLSGGGGLGVAHIGFLQELVQNGIKIDMVAGTSMGSLVGAIFAAGYNPKEMIDVIETVRRNRLIDIGRPLTGDGLVAGKNVVKFLKKYLQDKNIEDLKMPYCAVACDLKTGSKISFRSGNAVEAVRASISVPAIFSPVKKDGMILVDGGIIDNLPVTDLREMGADIIISSDVHGEYHPEGNLNKMLSVLISSQNMMQKIASDAKLDKGDVYAGYAQPNVRIAGYTVAEMKKSVNYGKEAAKKIIPQIKELIEQKKEQL